jgi:hypothetical protein
MSKDSPAVNEQRERVRRLCLSWPEATERTSHGEAAWFVKKQFAMFADHHHDDRVGLWAAAPEGAQVRWLETAPERFFRPPYVGTRGWIGVYLDLPLSGPALASHQDDLAEIIEDAYRHIAPVRLVRALDARTAD